MITLDDVQDYLDGWHKYSNYAMTCCVFHTDNNPSMVVSERGYYCKSCGASGSLEKLYAHVSGRPIQIRKKEYNPSAFIWKRWEQEFGDIKSICSVAHQQIKYKPELGTYLYKRGLDSATVSKGMLGYLGGYFIFPVRDENGIIQGAVARASPTIQTKNNRYSVSDNTLKVYVPDWKLFNEAEEVYVCYGTLDAWSLLLAGYPSLTGISGQEFNASLLDKIRKPIYIIADKHEQRSAIHLQAQLGWRGKRLDLDWPDDVKDPNGIHVNYGLEVLKDKIEKEKEKYNYGY